MRLIKLFYVSARHGLFRHLLKLDLPTPLKAVLWLIPWWLIPSKKTDFARSLKHTLEDLGPVPIKFGQLLSTRGDIVGQQLAKELASLQDDVPGFDVDLLRTILQDELGEMAAPLLSTISPTPLASASIAQVHTAKLGDKDVVVKVVRPNIEKLIAADFAWLSSIARILTRHSSLGARLRLDEVVEDLHKILESEIDLRLEAGNTTQLRSNFQGSKLLYIPEVHYPYCSERVMTSERIYGIGVDQAEAIDAAGFDRKKLAEHGVEIFFTQVFEHNFFHADMHPGNIMVDKTEPSLNRYIGIDCAIIGTLSREDQYYMGQNLIAIFEQNYMRTAELHIASGWVSKDTKAHEFAATMRSLCEPIFAKPLGEISLAEILLNLFATARRYDMRIQPSLILLQKTLLHVEGLGRSLYPDLDLWNTALPFLKRWSEKNFGPLGVAKALATDIPKIAEQMPLLPDRLRRLYQVIDSLDQPRTNIMDRLLNIMMRSAFIGGAIYCLHLSSQTTSVTPAIIALALTAGAIFTKTK